MKLSFLLAAALLSGCAARQVPPMPQASNAASVILFDADRGTLAGSWRGESDPRLTVSIMETGGGRMTFSAARGCVVTGGLLLADGAGYRIDRYESGFSTEGCGPWRAGPEVRPFDGERVQLRRAGVLLTAEGPAGAVRLRRIRELDLTVRPEHLSGTWRLLAARPGRPEREARSRLTFEQGRFVFASACNREVGDLVTLPGLVIVMGGSERLGQVGDCDVRTSGDMLVEQLRQNSLRFVYRPADDRIVGRLGATTYEFVRG